MTSGAQRTAPLGGGQAGGTVGVTFGTTISARIKSMGGLAPGARSAGSNAPVAVLSRFGVGRFASITSSMWLNATTVASTPYLANASPAWSTAGASACGAGGDVRKFTAAFLAGSYGAAASWTAGVVIVWVRNVYATAISDL